MAPLRYAAKFGPFLSLDCARVKGSWGCIGRDQILPSGNLAKVTDGDRKAIRTACDDIVRKAQALGPDVASVDFSACHSQPRGARVADLVGGTTVSRVLRDLKSSVDPFNRFRFHPIGDL